MLYAPNLPDGYAYVGIVLASTYTLEGWPLEGLVLLLDYAFMMWDLRKLYGEILGVNWSSWSRALGRYFQEEGQLKEHTFFGGRWWDMHIVAVYRDDWLNRTKLKTTAAQPT
jgi:RimJ/RimL family protein N-acetyltransferase